MSIFLMQKGEISSEMINHEYIKLDNRFFIIRSDFTDLRTVSLDFKEEITDDLVYSKLKSFVELFMKDFPFSKAAATIWNDPHTCIITVNPVGGAA